MGMRLMVMEGQREAIPKLKQWMKPEMGYFDIDLRDNTEGFGTKAAPFFAKLDISGEIVSTRDTSDDSVTLLLDTGDAFTGDPQSESRADESAIATVQDELGEAPHAKKCG